MYVEYVKCNGIISKPNQATMRPDRVSASNEFGAKHLAHMERQTDEQMDDTSYLKEPFKTRLSIISFSLGSHRGQKPPITAVLTQT